MTLSIYSAGSLSPLANHLTERLRTPLLDPMMPELVAVPSVGLQRWLKLHMAATLGASPGAGDGIAANIDMPFPGILRSQLFSADRGDEEDPWRLSRLTFAVHRVLLGELDNSALGAVTRLPAGATWYGRSRRIADLFDRYGTRRPDMIRQWAKGEDCDPAGGELRREFLWQPALFRMVRSSIGSPSPSERLPELLAQVQADSLDLDLPPRFSIFGVSTLPGGQAFADILKAFGEHRDVDLYMVDPAPATTKRVRRDLQDKRSLSRQDDDSSMKVKQPLLRSWGRAARESQILLPRLGLPKPEQIPGPEPADAASLLSALQKHMVADLGSAGDFTPEPQDTSIQIHACTGNARQVEVLRDALLAQLRDDPTLNESDILVVCPDLTTFAPLIPGALGPSADRAVAGRSGLPRLRYTISDRDLPTDDVLNQALLALVDMVGGRYQASRMLDFLSLPPVADAFMFDADDLDQIEDWLAATQVRWGLNEANRERNDLPGLETNTWRHGLHQLLVGMAVNDDDLTMGPGQVPATGVEGGGVATLSRLLSFLARMEEFDRTWTEPTTIGGWNERLSGAVVNLFQVPFHDAWQIERARTAIAATVVDAAVAGAQDSAFSLTELSQLLVERLGTRSARPRFFDGAITFTSLRPLRWVPHRVIAILGLDESALIRPRVSGDDILGASPDLGDPDQRADQRQALLETVLSAQDTLLITRSGRDVKSNKLAPPSIAVAELLSELKSILAPEVQDRVLDGLQHARPRHTFDPKNFLLPDPFSFDDHALGSAKAKVAGRRNGWASAAREPLPALDPDRITEVRDLHDLLQNGAKLFLSRRLGATFRQSNEGLDDNIPAVADYLLEWSVLNDLIATGRQERTLDPHLAILRRRGAFPPGPAGEAKLHKQRGIAEEVIQAATSLGALKADDTVDIVIDVPGLRLRGQVGGLDRATGVGPSILSASRNDDRMRTRLWLDLCLLTAQHPETDWTAIAIAKPDTAAASVRPETLRVRGSSPEERKASAIKVLVALQGLLVTGLTEPLPIFAKVIVKDSEEGRISGWSGNHAPDSNPYVRTAFGELSDSELLEIQSRPNDPGEASETRRFIRLYGYLEGLRSESTEAGVSA